MKVSQEHLDLLKKWMQTAMSDRNVTKDVWEESYKGFTEQRKVWDLFHATMNHSVMSRDIIRPVFNIYKDDHIETAIKKVYSEL